MNVTSTSGKRNGTWTLFLASTLNKRDNNNNNNNNNINNNNNNDTNNNDNNNPKKPNSDSLMLEYGKK